MKNKWLQFKKRFHKYMCGLEEHGYLSPIGFLFIIVQLIKAGILLLFIYYAYKFFKSWIEWVVR